MRKENVNIIQFSTLDQWNNKYTWFFGNIFVSYRKWEIKNVVVLDAQSAKQGMLFLHVSNVLGVCRGMHAQSLPFAGAVKSRINGFFSMNINIIKFDQCAEFHVSFGVLSIIQINLFFGSRVKGMVVAHDMLDLKNASQKNCFGKWTSHPQMFYNTSFDVRKASKLPDSFLQENSIWKVAKGKNHCCFLKFFNFFSELVWEYGNVGKLILSSETQWKQFKSFFVHSQY